MIYLMSACPFCDDGRVAESISAKEKMFGPEGIFTYRRCGGCGSLYLSDAPTDLTSFYPAQYYSYAGEARSSAIRQLKELMRARAYVRFLRRCGAAIRAGASFVDVGSGSGGLLRALQAIGFPRVLGIDPYMQPGTNTHGVTIVRRAIEDVVESIARRKADVVMFHHSLEHVSDPASSLRAAAELLTPAGAILVRIPIS